MSPTTKAVFLILFVAGGIVTDRGFCAPGFVLVILSFMLAVTSFAIRNKLK